MAFFTLRSTTRVYKLYTFVELFVSFFTNGALLFIF